MKIQNYFIYILILTTALLSFAPLENISSEGAVFSDTSNYMCRRIDTLSGFGVESNVNRELNTLEGNIATLDRLFEKLLRIKGGSNEIVSTLHIGDSHVQGGYFTNRFRDLMSSEFGFAGNGLVMPYQIIGTNGELDYSIRSVNNWTKSDITRAAQRSSAGFTGYSIESNNNSIEFVINSDSAYNLVRVLHAEDAPLLMADPSMADYDSPNMAAVESSDILLNQSVNRVVLRGRKWGDYNNHMYYGFILESGNPGVLNHTLGVNGACFKHYDDSAKFKSLSIFNPDLIIVSLGTNDSFYTPIKKDELENSIKYVVRSLKLVAPMTPIIVSTPVENFRNYNSSGRARKEPNANIDMVSSVIESVVQQEGILLWDFHSIMGGKGSSKRLSKSGTIRLDGIHFTVEGYEMQGELLYDALAKAYNKYISNQR